MYFFKGLSMHSSIPLIMVFVLPSLSLCGSLMINAEIVYLLPFYTLLWCVIIYRVISENLHPVFKILLILPIIMFLYRLEPVTIFTTMLVLATFYKFKPKIHMMVVLIITILICFLYYRQVMNLYVFQKMCENKEYYVEIVNSNYSIDEIKNREYRILNTQKSDLCDKDVQYCPKNTTVVHDGNVFLKNTDRLIAKIYKVFRPYSRLEIVVSSFSRELHGEYCGYNDISEILIKNSKGASNE